MSEYSSLLATINANVKVNNNQEITGAILNSVLNAMVASLGAGYQFMGMATPTNPGTAQTPDYKCFYLATTPGTYTNLGGLVVADGEVAILKWDSTWTKEVTGIATADHLNQLSQQLYSPDGENISISDCIETNGYVRKSDGGITTNSRYRTYTYGVKDYKYFIAQLAGENDTYAISFADIDGVYIPNSGIVGVNALHVHDIKYYKAVVPNNAVYIRLSTWANADNQIYGGRTIEYIEQQLELLLDETAYLRTNDYTTRINQYVKYSNFERVATNSSYTYYYSNDNFDVVVVSMPCKSMDVLAVGFLDANGNFLPEYKTLASIGEHIYCVDVPADAKNIVVCDPEKSENTKIWLLKNSGKTALDSLNEVILKPIVQKNRFQSYDSLKGYIRNSGDGSLVSSGGARTLIYKNQGIKSIDVYSTNPGTDGTTASFNVISFYSVDGWLGGQGYMQDKSIAAVYGSRKHYHTDVPDGCGIILITLSATSGEIDDATAAIELQSGGYDGYLETIDHITDKRFALPDYYSESYLRNKVNLIQKRAKLHASDSDCFIWQTDEHFERSAGYNYGLIRQLANRLNIPRLFSGGDTAHMGINMDLVKLRKKAFDGKIYQVIGNHEYLSYTFAETGATTEDEIFYGLECCYGNEVKFGNNKRHYYYVDNSIQRIRYIILNAFAQGDGITNSASVGYEQEQLSWLTDVALAVESGWSIIIFTHRLYEGNPYPGTLYVPESCQPVINIIEAYNGNGKIIAVFQGHTHFDRILHISNNTIPVIITTCDNNGLYKYDEALQEYVRDYDVERESGTIREHAFDVVTIDKILKRISLVRIGCPARDGSEPGGELVEERIVYWQ